MFYLSLSPRCKKSSLNLHCNMILQFFVPSLFEIGPVVMGEVIKVTSLFPIQLPPMKDCTRYTYISSNLNFLHPQMFLPSWLWVFLEKKMRICLSEDKFWSRKAHFCFQLSARIRAQIWMMCNSLYGPVFREQTDLHDHRPEIRLTP